MADRFGTYWNYDTTQRWFRNHMRGALNIQELTEPQRRTAVARAQRGGQLAEGARVTAQARADLLEEENARFRAMIDELQGQIAGFQENATELNAVRAEFAACREQLDQAERLIEAQGETIAEQKARIDSLLTVSPDEPQSNLAAIGDPLARRQAYDFLSAMQRLANVAHDNRRRYDDLTYDLAFIPHRYSPVAYEVLRNFLPLPARRTLQEHFRAVMHERIEELQDISLMQARIERHFLANGLTMETIPGLRVVLAIDATGISDTGQEGHSGYGFTWGLLPLNANLPGLWIHVMPSVTGAHGRARAVEQKILAVLQKMGLRVTFLATDGDHGLDADHVGWHNHYADAPLFTAIEDIFLLMSEDEENLLYCIPVSDPLHLLKNLRQRIRNHPVAAGVDRDEVCAADVAEVLGGFAAIEHPGRRNAMNDALALQAFRAEIAMALLSLGMQDASAYFVPWALLHAAIGSDAMTRAARLQALEVAFAMFRVQYTHVDETGKDFGIFQRGDTTEPQRVLTYADANQLRRAMNTCIAIYAALKLETGDVALNRIGTHDLEGHFGIVRTALRGQSQWRSWLSAEAFASLLPEFRTRVGIARAQQARGRAAQVGAHVLAQETTRTFDEWDHFEISGECTVMVHLGGLLASATISWKAGMLPSLSSTSRRWSRRFRVSVSRRRQDPWSATGVSGGKCRTPNINQLQTCTG
jgi:hypothetical protein